LPSAAARITWTAGREILLLAFKSDPNQRGINDYTPCTWL
jgi:hypothetical protein